MHNKFSIFTYIHYPYEGANHRLHFAQHMAGDRQNVQRRGKKNGLHDGDGFYFVEY